MLSGLGVRGLLLLQRDTGANASLSLGKARAPWRGRVTWSAPEGLFRRRTDELGYIVWFVWERVHDEHRKHVMDYV